MRQVRGIRNVEPEEVAAAIVDALKTGRVDVYVPKELGPISAVTRLLPRRVQDALTRVLKSNQIAWGIDRSRRAEYEARAARSEPGREPERADASTAEAPAQGDASQPARRVAAG
jgi:hypothetical protein